MLDNGVARDSTVVPIPEMHRVPRLPANIPVGEGRGGEGRGGRGGAGRGGTWGVGAPGRWLGRWVHVPEPKPVGAVTGQGGHLGLKGAGGTVPLGRAKTAVRQ